MKTSRSLLHGFSKPFGLVVLFTMSIVWASDVVTVKPTATMDLSVTDSPRSATGKQEQDVNTTPIPEKHSDVSLASYTGSKPLHESPSSKPKSKDMTLTPKLPPKQPLAVTMPLTSHPEKKATSTTVPSLSDQQGTVKSAQGTVGDISKKPRQTEKEREITTAPPQDMLNITGRNPPIGVDKEAEPDSVGASSLGMNYIIIIVVVVFCFLVVIVFLWCRFKH